MFTEETRVHYVGFSPSAATQANMAAWVKELHLESPPGACVRAEIHRRGRTFFTEVKITSRGGHFEAFSEGPNLYLGAREALRRIRKQLDKKWTVRHHAQVKARKRRTPLPAFEPTESLIPQSPS